MKLLNNIRNYISDNSFIVTIYTDRVNIINYNSIDKISNNNIIINSDKKIKIEGKNLKLNKLFSDELLIMGIISNISIYE